MSKIKNALPEDFTVIPDEVYLEAALDDAERLLHEPDTDTSPEMA